jgi:hypothetical protein
MAPEKIDSFVPENFQGFLFHYLGVFVPGTSVPLSGRIRIWFQENFQRFLSHYTAKDGARKNCQCCSRKFSGIFVPLSGRICARGFCPTIWTYIANRKIFREFCPTILPKMAPEKIDNFVPENFQGFLSHYLGVFVPGASVPLSGRILPTGKFSEIFVPLYCQRWHPKNWQFCTRKLSGIFVPLSGRICARDFCPTIWTYKNLVPGKFSEIFVPLYCQRWRPKKIDNFAPENFQGFSSHYLGVFVPGTSVPLSGRILPKMAPKKWPIWFQENFQRFLSHYLGVYWGRWRPKNGHLVLKGIFSEAAAAAFSVFSNMVDCSYFAFFDAFVVCCLRPSPSSSSWTSPP